MRHCDIKRLRPGATVAPSPPTGADLELGAPSGGGVGWAAVTRNAVPQGPRSESAARIGSLGRVRNTDLPPARDPYSAVAVYTAEPLLSGFASDDNVAKVKTTPALLADRLGDGLVVRIADNSAFRAIWWGTSRLVANALFFSGAVEEVE